MTRLFHVPGFPRCRERLNTEAAWAMLPMMSIFAAFRSARFARSHKLSGRHLHRYLFP